MDVSDLDAFQVAVQTPAAADDMSHEGGCPKHR